MRGNAPRARARCPAVLRAAALLVTLGVILVASNLGCSAGTGDPGQRKRVIVLGFDGMDYGVTQSLMAAGRMPNFRRLAEAGHFSPLGTSVPPQSPVAWSSFITGMDPGGHGIFDFIHRDPQTMIPYLSTSRTEAAGRALGLGKWRIPLSAGKVELLRHGEAFWEVLDRHGIETTIVRMPANFPPSGTATREVSGMGTPDILGTYGTFSYYATDTSVFAGEDISGGRVYEVHSRDDVVEGVLHGPDNPFLAEPEEVSTGFSVYIDRQEPVAKLVVGGEERVLEVGEWTDWVPIEFKLIPTQSLRGMCRFYLKQVRPEFKLYVTPINLDPMDAAMPISTPASYAAELARATGRFYTQGMPEDTKALTEGVFEPEEFLAQAHLAGDENIEQYKYVLERFDAGVLFYYFGTLDQVSHMMWRPMDEEHPAYDAAADSSFAEVVHGLYERMDDIVGYTLERMDAATTLIVMSDHGFASWRRAFHLNTWLKDNGYLTVRDPRLRDDPGMFANVDWRRTRAYGLGLNGLYINSRGRERWGVVAPRQRQALVEEITRKLLATIDPATAEPAVTKVYRREEVYEDRGFLEIGPDLIVGYAKGTRCSNESALGKVPAEVFTDNADAWSGDHCMDHEAVPGILLTNRELKEPAPSLEDLAAAILAEFGIAGFGVRD